MSVCLPVGSDEKCSRALNLHLSRSGLSQVSLRSVLGLFLSALLDYLTGQMEPKLLSLVDKHSKISFISISGSDHRHCCSTSGVPGVCLDWCRGEPLADEVIVILDYLISKLKN